MGLSSRIDEEACGIYLEEMLKWNKTHNLTAITKPHDMTTKHIADSLSIHPYVTGKRIADVGSGAGLPGIPLALLFPEKTITLIETSAKKTAFLRHIQRKLNLKKLEIIQEKVENYRPEQKFDQVITRAFSSLQNMLLLTQHLCLPEGLFLAMKGLVPDDELAAIRREYPDCEVKRLSVPYLEAERHVVIIQLTHLTGTKNG